MKDYEDVCDQITLTLDDDSELLCDVIATFPAKVNGVDVPYEIKDRRPGDIAENFADATRAKEVLGWTAKYGIEDMCRSSWNFTLKALERKSK